MKLSDARGTIRGLLRTSPVHCSSRTTVGRGSKTKRGLAWYAEDRAAAVQSLFPGLGLGQGVERNLESMAVWTYVRLGRNISSLTAIRDSRALCCSD